MNKDEPTVLFTSGGGDNPYHRLLFDALEDNGVEPIQEPLPIFLPLTRAVLSNDDLDTIHMDWLYGFFMVLEFTPSSVFNTIITIGRTVWFCVDLLLVKLLGVQLVWTVHNKYHHERYYFRIERVLNIVVANLVDRLTVKCETAKETISSIYKVRDETKIAVIPDGHYVDAYPNEVGRDEARSWLNVRNKFVYVYFGQIRPYKGVRRLIETFQSVDDEEAVLWIVGNPKTEHLEADIRSVAKKDERVYTHLEYVPGEEVQYYMNAADVLVFPYREILNSGSVYLGQTFGKPIIAPKIGCIPETIPPENELLYDQGQENLLNMLNQAREQKLQKMESRVETLDWGVYGKKYSQIYSD